MPSNGFDSVLSGPRVGNVARKSCPAGTASVGVSVVAKILEEGFAIAEAAVAFTEEWFAVAEEAVAFIEEGLAVAEEAVAVPEDGGAALDESAGVPSPPPLPHAVSVASRNSISIPGKTNFVFTIFFLEKRAARRLSGRPPDR